MMKAVTSHFNIYLNAGNKMFQIIETDQDNNQPGFALAQGTVACGLSGKKLVLTINIDGLDSAGDAADTVGQVTLNGKGKITSTETFTNDGAVTTLAVYGKFRLHGALAVLLSV